MKITTKPLAFYRKDPNQRKRNAIWSFSTENRAQLNTTAVDVAAGHETTWRLHDVQHRHVTVEKPPQRHTGLEVEDAMAAEAPQLGVAP